MPSLLYRQHFKQEHNVRREGRPQYLSGLASELSSPRATRRRTINSMKRLSLEEPELVDWPARRMTPTQNARETGALAYVKVFRKKRS